METESFFKRMRRLQTEIEAQEQADASLFQEIRNYLLDPIANANDFTVDVAAQATGTLRYQGDVVCEFSVVQGNIGVTAATDPSEKKFAELEAACDHITSLAAIAELEAKREVQRRQQEAMTMHRGSPRGKDAWMAS
jgi:hypothetical protein